MLQYMLYAAWLQQEGGKKGWLNQKGNIMPGRNGEQARGTEAACKHDLSPKGGIWLSITPGHRQDNRREFGIRLQLCVL